MMLLTSMATNNEEEFSISRPNISQQKQKLSENAKVDEKSGGNVQKITRTESASQYFSMTFKGDSDLAGKAHVMIREISACMLHKTLRKESLSSPNDLLLCKLQIVY